MARIDNIFTARALARDQNISDTAIRNAWKAGRLFKIEKGKYTGQFDLSDPRNKEEIDRIRSDPRSGSRTNKSKKQSINKQLKEKKKDVICNNSVSINSFSNEKQNKSKLELEDYLKRDENLTTKNVDSILDLSDLRILKEREAIREKQLKNREMRGELVDRKNVSFVFNKLWSIDSSQLTTLGSKLSPEIASICSVDDPIIITKIRTKIDDEIYKTLGHCKRLLMECLGKIGADNLEEE